MKNILLIITLALTFAACKKSSTSSPPVVPVVPPSAFNFISSAINGNTSAALNYNVGFAPVLKFSFSDKVDRTTVAASFLIKDNGGMPVNFTSTFQNSDSVVLIQPAASLAAISKYILLLSTSLKSQKNVALSSGTTFTFITKIDSSRKFSAITDNELLDKTQSQTFKYFYDFGHPVSGLARERNTSGETVTSGGSGFGVMALLAGVNRNFITRAQGFSRLQTITSFLKNTAQTFHGAYPHWLNGSTGVVIPFSTKDNGADLVETSFLIQGLLCARQFFNGTDAAETTLRNDINFIYDRVEWDWFTQGNQNVLYWHWSPNYNWDINLKIKGWNETLVTYVLARSAAPAHRIPASVYTSGWTGNGSNGFTNGNSYYGYQLPLGENLGGPLFFEHYSFLGINPNGLSDGYANYATQTKNHTLINYSYCIANPKNYFGYSDSTWGLTASDIPNGYTASSPTNDVGVIAPTAAISSLPYTPAESMKALKFYYYVLGDKIFKQYGFVDAFRLNDPWFADSFLAIDQGPIIVQIENYRTGLLWNLFTSCPEVKAGMLSLGFSAPYL